MCWQNEVKRSTSKTPPDHIWSERWRHVHRWLSVEFYLVSSYFHILFVNHVTD